MSSALKVNWTYGFSKNITNGVHSLSVDGRQAIFYVSSHSGVIYDFENRTQMILQGHCNPITCCAVSADKKWIVTADSGEEPILVVWDSLSGAPVKTIFSPHAGGVKSLDISSDSLYVVTLSEASSVSSANVAMLHIDECSRV
jgi:WD40 repeat protein